MMRGTIGLFQPNRFDSTAGNVIDPEEVDMRLCLQKVKSFALKFLIERERKCISFFNFFVIRKIDINNLILPKFLIFNFKSLCN